MKNCNRIIAAGLAAASVAQAAPQENTSMQVLKLVKHLLTMVSKPMQLRLNPLGSFHRNLLLTSAVFGGYQIINRDNLGLAELGYDDFGRVKGQDLLS